jgi:hypothetical protein
VACTAFTLGVGAIVCGAAAGAVGSALTSSLKGNGTMTVLQDAGTGALFGAVGGGIGNVAGGGLGAFGASTFRGAISSAPRAGLSAAASAGKQLFSRDAAQVMTGSGLKSLYQTHKALLGSPMGRGVYPKLVKEAFPAMLGAGAVGGFFPSGPDDLNNFGNFSPSKAAVGFLTGL